MHLKKQNKAKVAGRTKQRRVAWGQISRDQIMPGLVGWKKESYFYSRSGGKWYGSICLFERCLWFLSGDGLDRGKHRRRHPIKLHWKRGNYRDSKKDQRYHGLGRWMGWRDGAQRTFSRWWNSSAGYYNGRYKSLHICQNLQNVHHQGWTPVETTDFRWWYVHVGPPIATNVPRVRERRGYGKSLYFALSFTVNLKLLWNLSFIHLKN